MFIGYFSQTIALSKIDLSEFTAVVSELTTPNCTRTLFKDEHVVFEFLSPSSSPNHKNFAAQHFDQQNISLILIGQMLYDEGPTTTVQPDLPYLLEQYLAQGIGFVESLGGEFALLIFDYANKRFYAVRDHVGTVPLTLIRAENGIFFGSDTFVLARQLCKDQPLRSAFTTSRFFSYAENYSISPFENLIRVLPGNFISLGSAPLKNEKYWFPERIKVNRTIEFVEASRHLHGLLESAVSLRIDPSESIGAHISGGLDSSIVAVMCRRKCAEQSRFYGFSWSPPYAQVAQKETEDERRLIDALCSKEQIEAVYTSFTKDDYLEDLSDWKHPLDFPYERNALRNAHARGVHVLFSGWGGDEFMGLRDTAFLSTLFKRGNWRKFWNYRQRKDLKGGLAHIVNNALVPRRRRPVFRYKTSQKFLPYLPLDNCATDSADMYRSPAHFMLGILNRHHLADRCESWYNLGQEYGIRYSYPMLDRRIIEYCLQLDAAVFAHGTLNKPLIREIGKAYLTEELTTSAQLFDPVLFENSDAAKKQAIPELLKQFPAMKENAHLSVFHFTAFEKNMEAHMNEDLSYVLTYLAAAHAITRGLTTPNQA